MEEYLKPVIKEMAERVDLQLTEEQARELVAESGYEEELIETNGLSIGDTAPRSTLIACLFQKLAGCDSPCFGDSEEEIGYIMTKFWKGALREGYNFVED